MMHRQCMTRVYDSTVLGELNMERDTGFEPATSTLARLHYVASGTEICGSTGEVSALGVPSRTEQSGNVRAGVGSRVGPRCVPLGLTEASLVIDLKVRGLCGRPYPGHPKGCPNVNHKKGCPPSAPLLPDVFDLSRPVWIIINRFDLGAHVERMRTLHPDWSTRQLTCCLY